MSKKNVLKWLLTSKIYDKFVDNLTEDIKDYIPEHLNEDLISDAFDWGFSSEGTEFWINVDKEFREWYNLG